MNARRARPPTRVDAIVSVEYQLLVSGRRDGVLERSRDVCDGQEAPQKIKKIKKINYFYSFNTYTSALTLTLTLTAGRRTLTEHLPADLLRTLVALQINFSREAEHIAYLTPARPGAGERIL